MSVALAATFVILFTIDVKVLAPSTVEVAWWEAAMDFYSTTMLLCGVAGGIVGLIAVLWRHERSVFAWLTMLLTAKLVAYIFWFLQLAKTGWPLM